MAEKLVEATVVMGRMIPVKNLKRPEFSNAKTQYIAVFVEDADGKNERCLLFTDREIKAAEYRASRNPEDLTKQALIPNMLT